MKTKIEEEELALAIVGSDLGAGGDQTITHDSAYLL